MMNKERVQELKKITEEATNGHANAAFVVAFNPWTVLEMISELEKIERFKSDKAIDLNIIGEYVLFQYKMVKILLAMSRHLNLLPEARQAGFFYEDASLDDITSFAEKCLERLKMAHQRDSIIENLVREKVG